jgi:hypothetical protein
MRGVRYSFAARSRGERPNDSMSDFTVAAASCNHTWTGGWLLVTSIVYWSHKASLGFLPRAVLGPSGFSRQQRFVTRPKQLRAERCADCGTCRTIEETPCTHDFLAGYLFPYAPIFWWAGDEAYRPTFLFPWVTRSKDGREPEPVLVPDRFMLTMADANVPACRCAHCGAIEIPPIARETAA